MDVTSQKTNDSLTVVSRLFNTSVFQYFYVRVSQSGFLLFAAAVAAFVWSNIAPECPILNGLLFPLARHWEA